jgi:hypothetical protein
VPLQPCSGGVELGHGRDEDDRRTFVERPGDVVIEGIAEVAQGLILGRAVAGDRGDLLDPVEEIPLAATSKISAAGASRGS